MEQCLQSPGGDQGLSEVRYGDTVKVFSDIQDLKKMYSPLPTVQKAVSTCPSLNQENKLGKQKVRTGEKGLRCKGQSKCRRAQGGTAGTKVSWVGRWAVPGPLTSRLVTLATMRATLAPWGHCIHKLHRRTRRQNSRTHKIEIREKTWKSSPVAEKRPEESQRCSIRHRSMAVAEPLHATHSNNPHKPT